jgi:hypothetical protein
VVSDRALPGRLRGPVDPFSTCLLSFESLRTLTPRR